MTKKEKLLLIYEKLYHFYGPQHWWPADNWFEVTIGAILTQNTTWKNVEKSIHNIKQNNLMNPNKLYELEKNELAKIIKSSGFYNLKSERIKNFFILQIKLIRYKLSKSRFSTQYLVPFISLISVSSNPLIIDFCIKLHI